MRHSSWLLCPIKSEKHLCNSFEKRSRAGLSGFEVVTAVQQNNLSLRVEETPGQLTDHYDPSREILRLSTGVARGGSIADYSIAAHEVGHALQKREKYGAFALRSILVPVASIGSQAAFPLFFIGLIFSFRFLMDIGIIFFSLAVLFKCTLPVRIRCQPSSLCSLTNSGIVAVDEQRILKCSISVNLYYLQPWLPYNVRLILLRQSRD